MPLPEPIKIANKTISSFFGSNIHNTLVDEKNGSFSLSKAFSTLETSDLKGIYTLWRFPVKVELEDIWIKHPIYFAFKITLKANDEIADVNIKLFKDDNTKVTNSSIKPTELLLRVEWSNDVKPDNKGKLHAQPHWHIHSYTIVDKLEGKSPESRDIILQYLEADDTMVPQSIFLNSMEEEDLLQEVIEGNNTSGVVEKEIPSFKFHLAMLAEWDKSSIPNHSKKLTNEIFKLWLPQCLNYIQEQLEYILEKM